MTNHQSTEYGALLLRVSVGVLFLAHGALKIFVFTPAGTVGYFGSLGLPPLFAYLTIFAETAGGFALIAGLFARWVSLALIPILVSAVVFVHGSKGWLFSNEGGGWEFPVFWAFVMIVQALLGNGAYSIQPHVMKMLKKS